MLVWCSGRNSLLQKLIDAYNFCLNNDTIQTFVVRLKKKKKSNTFIYQGCYKLIKSDSEDLYNVTKDFYLIHDFKKNMS